MTKYNFKKAYVFANNETTVHRTEWEVETKLMELIKEGCDLEEVEIEIEFVEKGGRHSAMTEDLDFGFLECNGKEFIEEYC